MSNFFDKHVTQNIILNISDFDGPIELLYELIVVEKKYDIRTFPLAQITEQYMLHLEQVQKLDMEEAAEYIKIAAMLLEIKARECLPKIEEDEYEDEDYVDPQDELRRKILMFQLCKEQAIKLKEMETLNKFYRKPKFTNADAIIVVNDFSFDKLIEAYGKILLNTIEKEKKQATKKIQKDRFTVADKIEYISKYVLKNKSVVFNKLFEEDITRSEVITTFQALLELMKKQIVIAVQEDFGQDIFISLNEQVDADKVDLQELKKTEEKY
ncbi:MAG: segregation/condensation protein A [Clostridia bacterium]|nr:segregation/condensation protein A [Clostridia bacterium]MDE7328743.1 segregation/condensation protein A [Clostridia bacterium]